MTKVIRTGQWAQGALRQVVTEHVRRFEMMDDAYLRERASDVKDIGRRLLSYLQEARQQALVYPDKTILVSEELSPAMLGEVPEGKLVGMVSVLGSSNSHVAILARAMGIPTVMGAVDLPSKVDGIELIVDGYRGEIITNPGRCCASSTRCSPSRSGSSPKASTYCASCPAKPPMVTAFRCGSIPDCWPMWCAPRSVAPKAWGCIAPKCPS